MKFKSLITTVAFCLLLNNCSNYSPPIIETPERASAQKTTLAPTNRSASVNLNSLASRVINNHPQMRAATQRINEAKGQVIQSGRWSNPELGIDINKTGLGSEGGIQVSFAQRFPITNRLALEKRISRQQLEIARHEIDLVGDQLASEAQLIAIDILILKQEITQLSKQIDNLNTLSEFINEAASRGELSSLDGNQAKLEASSLNSKKERMKAEIEIARNKLKSYLGLPLTSPLRLSGSLPSPKLPDSQLILSSSPIYRAKELEIQKAEQFIALEKSKRFSDIELSGFAEVAREEDAPEGLETEQAVGVGVKIPLQLYDKNEGNIATARARAARLLLEKKALAAELKQQAATQKAEMKSWLSQANNISQKVIPQAEESSKQFETAYRNGQAPFTSLLSSRNQEVKLQSEKIEALSAFHKARVKYFSIISRPENTF